MDELIAARDRENRAFNRLAERINEGIKPTDSKVAVLRMVGELRSAAVQRKALELSNLMSEAAKNA